MSQHSISCGSRFSGWGWKFKQLHWMTSACICCPLALFPIQLLCSHEHTHCCTREYSRRHGAPSRDYGVVVPGLTLTPQTEERSYQHGLFGSHCGWRWLTVALKTWFLSFERILAVKWHGMPCRLWQGIPKVHWAGVPNGLCAAGAAALSGAKQPLRG
jgi:hypothetical protein